MAITVYREVFRLSKKQALRRIFEIAVSAGVIWWAFWVSSHEAGEYGFWQILLQAVACQGAALIGFHLYDLVGHFRVRDVSDPTMPISVRRLQQLAAPPQKDFLIFLPVAASFAAFIGAVLPFIEGGAQEKQWSNWISAAVAGGISAFWIFLFQLRSREIHPNEEAEHVVGGNGG